MLTLQSNCILICAALCSLCPLPSTEVLYASLLTWARDFEAGSKVGHKICLRSRLTYADVFRAAMFDSHIFLVSSNEIYTILLITVLLAPLLILILSLHLYKPTPQPPRFLRHHASVPPRHIVIASRFTKNSLPILIMAVCYVNSFVHIRC